MSVSKERSFVRRACCLFRWHQNWPWQGPDCQNLANPSRHQRAPKLHWSCHYYRRFISGFSIVAEPLYELSKKGVSFQRQMEQESAFNELKHRLTIAPVLAYPDFSPHAGLFVLDTDASQRLGIGAVLSRLQPNDTERVTLVFVLWMSRKKNYCVTRLEMLAMVNIFRWYLLGQKLRRRTDNHSLVWLMSLKEPDMCQV